MAKFRFSVNVEPKDIPHLDDSHKRDVADVLTSIINHTFKRTLIIAIASIAFFAAFLLFSFTFYMRMGTLLPQLPAAMPIVCIAVVLAEFVAGTMNKPAVIIEIVLCLAMALTFALSIPTLILIPFALYAALLNFKLLTLIPIHKAVSAEPGYPEFTPLPTKEEVAEAKKKNV